MYNNLAIIGNIGEAVAISEFTKRRIPVFIPFGQSTPCDLIAYIENKMYRIQCKTTKRVYEDGVMRFKICRTDGSIMKKIAYTPNDIDLFFLYCIENNYCGLVKIEDLNSLVQMNIRTDQPQILQRKKGIHMADEYHIDNQLIKILHQESSLRNAITINVLQFN